MPRTAILCACLAAAGWCVYARTPHFDFVSYDDPSYVTRNANLALGLSREGLFYAFTSGDTYTWHPLTWLSLLADREFHGLSAGGYHATNVVLHVLNTLLLFLVLAAMTGATWRSAIVAALFAVHPLHVESVAWISERKDVLSTCFGLLSIGAYAAYARNLAPGRYALAALCLALGLMAKPMLVTFPLLFLLLDYWPLERWRGAPPAAGGHFPPQPARRLVLEKLPLLLLSLLAAVATVLVQRARGAMGWRLASEGGLGLGWANLWNALVSYSRYLTKAIWPGELSVLYPHPGMPEIGGTPLTLWDVATAVVLLALATRLAFLARRRYALVGWSWFLVSLLPVIGLIQVGSQAMADRYTYIPLTGLFIVATWGGADLLERWRPRSRAALPLAIGLTAAALLFYGVSARRATLAWRNSFTLYEQALAVNPRNTIIRFNLADEFKRIGDLDRAIEQYRLTLELDPKHVRAHNNLGNALVAQGRRGEAAYHYRRAVELGAIHPQPYYNLATQLAEQGRTDEAVRYYRRALEIAPNYAPARRALRDLRRDREGADRQSSGGAR